MASTHCGFDRATELYSDTQILDQSENIFSTKVLSKYQNVSHIYLLTLKFITQYSNNS